MTGVGGWGLDSHGKGHMAIVLDDEVCAIFGWLAKWPTSGMGAFHYMVQLLTSSQWYLNSDYLLESPRELLKILMSMSHSRLITLKSLISVF